MLHLMDFQGVFYYNARHLLYGEIEEKYSNVSGYMGVEESETSRSGIASTVNVKQQKMLTCEMNILKETRVP